jgi:HK97 gp10 family phage protein
MAGSAWLDIEGIKARIREGERAALDEIGDLLAADAKRRAPIRKTFKERKGYRRRFRRLTPLEQRIATDRANAYYTHTQPNEFKRRRAVAHIRNYATVASPGKGSLNALTRSNRLRTLGYERQGKFIGAQPGVVRLVGRRSGGFEPGEALAQRLTSRGRYEIRSGRAIHREATASGNTRVRIGGALKASIGSEGVVETPSGMKVVVSAAIRYAKFVEFPTIHNAAQPFMRPALHAMRQTIPRIVAAHINRALRG